MIIVKLYGGLGNQMFQYAAGRALSLRNLDTLKLDLSWFKNVGNDAERPFRLNVFDIKVDEVSEAEIKNFIPKNKLFRILGLYDHRKYIKERHFDFDPNLLNLEGDVYLDGYWQSEKYFQDFAHQIREDFRLKLPLSVAAQEMKERICRVENSVAVHIRRGDYVRNPKTFLYHGVCPLEYYEKALSYLRRKVGDVTLFVFSDEIEWAKGQKLFENAIFVSSPELQDYEEMYLMSLCRHNVIANSSFSWWGAWLNRNENKIVVAPKRWFNVTKDTSNLIPRDWIRVKGI